MMWLPRREGIWILAIRHVLEPYAGRRFFKGDISVLFQGASRFKQGVLPTELDLINFALADQRFNSVVEGVTHAMGGDKRKTKNVSTLMRANDFPDLDEVEFYKFLPASTVEYYRAGSFQAVERRAAARAADIAPEIAKLQAGGAASLRAIAAGLNDAGIPTARGNGGWTATQVARVLERI